MKNFVVSAPAGRYRESLSYQTSELIGVNADPELFAQRMTIIRNSIIFVFTGLVLNFAAEASTLNHLCRFAYFDHLSQENVSSPPNEAELRRLANRFLSNQISLAADAGQRVARVSSSVRYALSDGHRAFLSLGALDEASRFAKENELGLRLLPPNAQSRGALNQDFEFDLRPFESTRP